MRHFDKILVMGLLRRRLNDISTEGYNGVFAYPTIKNRFFKFYLLKLVTRGLFRQNCGFANFWSRHWARGGPCPLYPSRVAKPAVLKECCV
jgi:hypothetical protein